MNVKEVIENVKEATGTAAQTAATKSKQVYSIAKARIAVTAEQDKIRKAQLELGKLFYQDYTAGEPTEGERYQPWCDKITESKAAIADLKEQIEDLKAGLRKKGEPVPEEDVDVEIYAVDPPVEVGETAAEPETADAQQPQEPAQAAEQPEAPEAEQ